MLQYFFTYGSYLPKDAGFPMFGAAHLCWLFFGTAITILLCRKYQKFSDDARRLMDKAAAWFLILLMGLRYLYLALVGELTIYELPLHLCSMAGILSLLHSYTLWDWTGQVLYALCLPGTIAALIFPDWTYYPPIHCITIEGFLFHFGVFLYVFMQLISHQIRPKLKGTVKVLLFLALTVPPVYYFNKRFATNYFFVNVPSPGSPLELFAKYLGVPGYLLGYAGLALIIIVALEVIGEKVTEDKAL